MTIHDLNRDIHNLSTDVYYNFDLTMILEFIGISIVCLYVYVVFRYVYINVSSAIKSFFNPEPPPIPEESNHYPVD